MLNSNCIRRISMLLSLMIALTVPSFIMAHEAAKDDGEQQALPPPPPIVVRATGYAAYAAPAKKDKAPAADPKRLLAIRASKLDAYRNLAERVYGIGLQGHSAVNAFTLTEDHFATAIDTMIRGARVVSVSENKNTGIETVMEILLPGDFQDCLNKINNFRYGDECLRPLTPKLFESAQGGQQRRVKPLQGMQTIYYLN